MTTLVSNIKKLVGVRQENKLLHGRELADLPIIENAYLIIEDGVIVEYGEMQNLKSDPDNYRDRNFKSEINGSVQFILQCWFDSQTHFVFAASREEDFVVKFKEMSYVEIA